MGARTVESDDTYVTKLVKYVPAESIALSTGFFAAFSPTDFGLWTCVAVFAVMNVVYLYGAAHVNDKRDDTNVHYYVLSGVAFVLWALATIEELATAAGLDGPQRAWLLGVATGTIPLLDSFMKNRFAGGVRRPRLFERAR